MRIQKRRFFSSLMLLMFSSLFISSYAFSQPGSDAGGNTQPGCEPQRPRAGYAEYAALIAGIRAPRSPLAPFESRPVWTEFEKYFDRNWARYDRIQLTPMRRWASRELSKAVSSGLTVFYPFSGPDFMSAYTLFPNADTYILMALEPVGKVPDFQAMSPEDFDSFFVNVRKLLHEIIDIDYFISSHMHTGMEGKYLDGVLPFLLFSMAREKTRILDVKHWFMGTDGTIREASALDNCDPGPKGAIPGIRILFEGPGSTGNKPRTLYYFRLNLYNSSFRRNRHFINFLENFGPFITLMKSAAYVMSKPQASAARQFVLDHSRHVLQEDSGIPLKYFNSSVWTLQFHGAYSGPISSFPEAYQADLARIYETGSGIKPLPFGIGYHFLVDTANLLHAARK